MAQSMSELVTLEKHTLLRCIYRDIKLLCVLFLFFIGWLIVGTKVKRTYRRCRAEGKPYYVDAHR